MIRPAALAAMFVVAAGPATPSALLAGRYDYHDRDPLANARLDNVMEIVPVDATHAYFRIALDQPNGQSCDVSGVARTASGGLFYRSLETNPDTGEHCALTVTRQGRDVIVDDTDSRLCRKYCGVNAELSDAFAWSSRRPITYMPRLKASRSYRTAIAEWRRQPIRY